MLKEQKETLIVCSVIGFAILISYVFVIQKHRNGSFDFWLGINEPTTRILYIFMLLAVIGFFMMVVDYCTKDTLPIDGLLSHKYAFVSLVGVALICALLWSIFVIQLSQAQSSTMQKVWGGLTSTSLIGTAVASLLILAGQFERSDGSVIAIVGALLFCIVTVLVDGIAWNSKLIYKLVHS
tara:strand:- start:7454 stop:7996 length:543 start_codon:yes stop_codon:yes gene_type:complete